MRNGSEVTLHRAGERWGAVHRDTETLADRVDALRAIMVEEWPDQPGAVHRVLDALVAGAAMALSNQLERDSRTDALTGTGNRRAFDEALDAALASAYRQHYGLSLVIVDIDGMKHINDSQGHLAGDDTLVRLAQAIERSVRKGDSVFRIGGDEFAVIMPYCAADHPATTMERIQSAGAPSFSWGVSSFPQHGLSPRSLMSSADAAMYRRKPSVTRHGESRIPDPHPCPARASA
jgi:diguanylate cyclase (GGDEF)-like protein